jgi:DNA-directed RNA polymerase specialized sigma24 family protein
MIEPTSLGTGEAVRAALTFEDFFVAEHEWLFKVLSMLPGNREEVDDLAQEALLRAYERWERVGTMDPPAGYVHRTALNLHRNRLRRLLVRTRRVFAAVPQEDLATETEPTDEDQRFPLSARELGDRVPNIMASGQRLAKCSASKSRP